MPYPGSCHGHTDFSNLRLRDCINTVESLIDYALELNQECIAFTDHECISSYIRIEEYYEKMKKEHPNFKVLRGNEIYLTRNGLNGNNFDKDKGDGYYHFILIAKDIEGYHQICELSTRAWLRSYVSKRLRRVPTYYKDLKEIVKTNKGHLIGSTACLGGQIARFLLKYRETDDEKYLETAKKWLLYMQDIFGEENFFLEMQPSNNKEQIYVNQQLLQLSKKLNIPYIITNDEHYLKKEDAPIHEAFLNSQEGDREVSSFYATTYLMDTEELESFFKYFTKEQIETAYKNIRKIKDSCEDFSIKRPLRIPCLPWKECNKNVDVQYWIKKIPSLKYFIDSSYQEDNTLVYATVNGIMRHKDLQNEEAYKALDNCLKITWTSSEVNNARWSAYYLNLQKLIDECWNAGTIVGVSRGSCGGFVLLYCLDIIQMNALRETTKCFPWRFLNPERVSVLDVDFDISGIKREIVLQHLRKFYGEDKITNVATFRTEKSKSAILTAARGLGIDNDTASYYASLVDTKRGANYTLKQMYYGDNKIDLSPNKTFVNEMNKNPKLWATANKIEGLINGLGIHASGVVAEDKPFTDSCSLMKAPDGTVISGFELHDLEKCSLIKYDILSVEAMDKIQVCIELLQEYGMVKPEATLKETYEKIIGIYNIERNDPKMWEMIWKHKIISLFQMEQSSGIQGIELIKPKNVNDLAVLNSVIRLMASEKGAEQPLDMWVRYRKNIKTWISEMQAYGLTNDEINWLKNNDAVTDGICESQEGLMSLVQDPRLGGNTLSFADKCRKALAKKIGKLMDECEKEYFENAKKANCNMILVHYVWDILLAPQKGYSFNRSHCLAYSLVALQEMNLAYKYPIIFWNTANLIVDSAGVQYDDNESGEDTPEIELEEELTSEQEEIVDIYEPEDWEEYDYEDLPDKSAKKKRKTKSVDFGKIATAIGKFQAQGIKITPPNINKSGFTFTPDVENNSIASGLRNITRISADLVNQIIANRPYNSIEDFKSKVKTNKTQMLMLLKCGAFDCLEPNRAAAIDNYIASISGQKNNLTLANVPSLIKYNILDEECAPSCELYSFNKFIRKNMSEDKEYIIFSNKTLEYYCNNYDIDLLEDNNKIKAKNWEKIYKKAIAPLSQYIKEEKDILMKKLNAALVEEQLGVYANCSLSKYEMESISCYFHPHELQDIDPYKYDIANFNFLSEEPAIERIIPADTGDIKIYELSHICGTVLNKNKIKNTVTLLTNYGVVNVKIYKTQFAKLDKRISEIGENGKKTVKEESWFKRGTLLYIQGMRRGECFIPKAYKNSLHRNPIMKITKVNGKDMEFTTLRWDEI